MTDSGSRKSGFAALRSGEFRKLLVAVACSSLASRAFAVLVGYQVYETTQSTMALGMLGLVEAIPALFLPSMAAMSPTAWIAATFCARPWPRSAFALWPLSSSPECRTKRQARPVLPGRLHGGLRRLCRTGRPRPRGSGGAARTPGQFLGLDGQRLAHLRGSRHGPGGNGLRHARADHNLPADRDAFAVAVVAISGIAPKPVPVPPAGESVWQSVATGVCATWWATRCCWARWPSICSRCSLAARSPSAGVRRRILHVGPTALGYLYAAPQVGSLVSMLWSCAILPFAGPASTCC